MAGTASRRLLFRETSDLSDVSPLSPSTEEEDENQPPNSSPNKNVTPIKGMKCLSSLSLESPVRVYSEGHTKVRGVHSLRCSSPTAIPTSRFYGSQTEPRNPSQSWLRDTAPKAKTKLFLDDLPSNKKRGRTSSGQKVQPAPKRVRRETSRSKRTLTFVPRLGQKAPFKRSKKKSPSHESRKRRRTVSPEGSAPVRRHSRSKTPNSKSSRALVSFKRHDGENEDCNSWNITFTKRIIPSNGSADNYIGSDKKFFKSPQGNKKIESKAFLTPPSSKRKQRTLCRPDLLYMSPTKSEQSPLRRGPRKKSDVSDNNTTSPRNRMSSPKKTSASPRKSPRKVSESPRKRAMISAAREMIKDIEEMMEDETVPETAVDISNLLDNLNHEEVKSAHPRPEDYISALPSPDEEATFSDGQAVDENMKKLFPVFHPNHARNEKSFGVSPKMNKNDGKRRSKLMGMGEDQYQIDNGQKGLCEVTCSTCGLFYSKGCPEDEVVHEKFHNSKALFTHQGWKKERVVGRKDLDRVIRIQPGDPRAWWNKVQNIVSLVDELLGFPPIKLDESTDPIVYLYVSREGLIVGCLVIEAIDTGYRLLTGSKDCGVDQCDDEPCPVRAGISRLWVHPTARRRRVGTSLLNSFRASFFYGTILRKNDIAVSVPTEEGKKFFASYMGCPDYLVYL